MENYHVGRILSVISIIGLLILIFTSVRFVDEGYRGLILRFGAIERQVDQGLVLKIPLVEKLVKVPVRTLFYDQTATSATVDSQDVTVQVRAQIAIDPLQVSAMYAEYGKNIEQVAIVSAIQESVKFASAHFVAEDLIRNRTEFKDLVLSSLRQRLSTEYLIVENVDIVELSFSEVFTQAIEAKVTAEQNAFKAENDLKRIQIESEQRIVQSKAEAEAIKIQAEAIQAQGGADYVKLQWIEAWKSGADVPNYIGAGNENFMLSI